MDVQMGMVSYCPSKRLSSSVISLCRAARISGAIFLGESGGLLLCDTSELS